MSEEKVQEVVGIFDDKDNLDAAISELESQTFPREMISVLGTKEAVEEHFGKPEISPELAKDDEDAPRMPPVMPEEKAIGAGALISGGIATGAVAAILGAGAAITVPAVITAAAIGGGSGAAVAKIIGDYFDENTQKQINEGGLLLWVQTQDAKQELQAKSIMVKHEAKKVDTHEIR